mmetsp:Transcript_6768/g.17720  ORF Transcript_6768/g.17720 Transcript_6768/m.17720 type:complete len:317 (-) Transcript_6768:533-1483(-)
MVVRRAVSVILPLHFPLCDRSAEAGGSGRSSLLHVRAGVRRKLPGAQHQPPLHLLPRLGALFAGDSGRTAHACVPRPPSRVFAKCSVARLSARARVGRTAEERTGVHLQLQTSGRPQADETRCVARVVRADADSCKRGGNCGSLWRDGRGIRIDHFRLADPNVLGGPVGGDCSRLGAAAADAAADQPRQALRRFGHTPPQAHQAHQANLAPGRGHGWKCLGRTERQACHARKTRKARCEPGVQTGCGPVSAAGKQRCRFCSGGWLVTRFDRRKYDIGGCCDAAPACHADPDAPSFRHGDDEGSLQRSGLAAAQGHA